MFEDNKLFLRGTSSHIISKETALLDTALANSYFSWMSSYVIFDVKQDDGVGFFLVVVVVCMWCKYPSENFVIHNENGIHFDFLSIWKSKGMQSLHFSCQFYNVKKRKLIAFTW